MSEKDAKEVDLGDQDDMSALEEIRGKTEAEVVELCKQKKIFGKVTYCPCLQIICYVMSDGKELRMLVDEWVKSVEDLTAKGSTVMANHLDQVAVFALQHPHQEAVVFEDGTYVSRTLVPRGGPQG
jgi:hypothetical protein